MKKIVSIVLCLSLIFCSALTAMAADDSWVETERNLYMPQGATIADAIVVNGTTFLDLSSLNFYMGWTQWKKAGSTNEYFGSRDDDTSMCVFPNSNKALLNDKEITMPFSTFTHKGQTYVPLSFVCQSMGYVVEWRAKDNAIYIQQPATMQNAAEVTIKSMEAVAQKAQVKTSLNNKTKMHYFGDSYTLESKGEIYTDIVKNIAYRNDASHLINQRYEEYNRTPEKSYTRNQYVTANGIYTLQANGSYLKEPVPPQNISTMDMASKSVMTDYELFLNSAYVSKDRNGDIQIESQTDVGLLLSIGFDIYIPEEAKSLTWSNTHQTITYDKDTYLPKKMELRLNATYIPDAKRGEKMLLIYEHQYTFDFNTSMNITLPAGVE